MESLNSDSKMKHLDWLRDTSNQLNEVIDVESMKSDKDPDPFRDITNQIDEAFIKKPVESFVVRIAPYMNQCNGCGKNLSSSKNLKRHEQICKISARCPQNTEKVPFIQQNKKAIESPQNTEKVPFIQQNKKAIESSPKQCVFFKRNEVCNGNSQKSVKSKNGNRLPTRVKSSDQLVCYCKPFSCPFCNDRYSDKKSMFVHLKAQHKDSRLSLIQPKWSSEDKKQLMYECSLCKVSLYFRQSFVSKKRRYRLYL